MIYAMGRQAENIFKSFRFESRQLVRTKGNSHHASYICCIGRKAHLNVETVKVNLRDLVKDSLKNEKVKTNLLIETSEQLQKYFENGPHQWKTD